MYDEPFESLSKEEQLNRIGLAQAGDIAAAKWVLQEVPRDLLKDEFVAQLFTLVAPKAIPWPKYRKLEVAAIGIAVPGLVYMLHAADFFHQDYRHRWSPRYPDFNHLLWWICLVGWCALPAALRPLSYPEKNSQQRGILLALIGIAGVCWWAWIGRDLDSDSSGEFVVNGIGIVAVLGFSSAAVIVRLGWGPINLRTTFKQ